MKKLISLIFVSLITLTVLVGCSTPTVPSYERKWIEETIVYDVSLNSQFKYPEISGSPLKPINSVGTYTTAFTVDSNGFTTLKTTLVLAESYDVKGISEEQLKKAEGIVTATDGDVKTFSHTVTTSVTFEKLPKTKPIASSREVKSVYVYTLDGVKSLAYNDFTASANYTDGKATHTDNTQTNPVAVTSDVSNANVDNEMLLAVARAIGFGELNEAKSVSINCYNLNNKAVTPLYIGMVAFNTDLKLNNATIKAHTVSISLNSTVSQGRPILCYFSADDKDTVSYGVVVNRARNKLVMMSQDHLDYTFKSETVVNELDA